MALPKSCHIITMALPKSCHIIIMALPNSLLWKQYKCLSQGSFLTDASCVALLLGKGGKKRIYVTVVDTISSVPDIGYVNGNTL